MKKTQMWLTVLKWIPAVFIICCSWYLSSQPTVEHIPKFQNADKIVHFVCFGILSFWIAFAIIRKKTLCIPLTSLYGIIDEIHQYFVPGRSCSFADWIADTIGAAAGYLAFTITLALIVKITRHHKE